MTIISDFMQKDHVDIDAIAERATNAAATGDAATMAKEGAEFLKRLRLHIDQEEKLLFPAFEERTGMREGGPSVQMKMEHDDMRPIIEQMHAAVAAKDAATYQRASKALFDILVPHNQKEEQMMYPMLDDTMGAEAGALLAEVKAMAA